VSGLLRFMWGKDAKSCVSTVPITPKEPIQTPPCIKTPDYYRKVTFGAPAVSVISVKIASVSDDAMEETFNPIYS